MLAFTGESAIAELEALKEKAREDATADPTCQDGWPGSKLDDNSSKS